MRKSITQQKPLLVIVGATGTGKSALAVTLAKALKGEVVSADSRQVYRGVDIGTGKLTKREMRGIPHHLLDVASLKRTYTAHQYQRDARHAIRAIWRRGKLPILCGGTGLYVRAVVDGVVFPEVPPNVNLRARLEKKTVPELYRLLVRKDPRRAKEIDRNNPRRLIRALEIADMLGKVPMLHAKPIDAFVLMLGTMLPKQELERRTRARINLWLRRGLLKESKKVPATRVHELGIVYQWASRLAYKEISRAGFIEGLTHDLMRYVKRQETWFRKDTRIVWLK
ncbi:MAG: tRNA (adenosine(37)-N6)-dimethylallyltransferase MiaA [Candidatus Brennerbacteria bacterium]